MDFYFFHYLPLQMEHGCNDSPGTFAMQTVDRDYKIQQPLPQFFVSQLINLEWIQPGRAEHQSFPAKGDVDDGAGHALVTAYALKRPDGQWSLLLVNRDQHNAHSVKIGFQDGDARRISQARWRFRRSARTNITGIRRTPVPPGTPSSLVKILWWKTPRVLPIPTGQSCIRTNCGEDTAYDLPAASIVVVRGKIGGK